HPLYPHGRMGPESLACLAGTGGARRTGRKRRPADVGGLYGRASRPPFGHTAAGWPRVGYQSPAGSIRICFPDQSYRRERMIKVYGLKWVPPMVQGLVRDLRLRWALEEAGL